MPAQSLVEAAFLGDKVRKWSLPVFAGRPPNEAPALKRMQLAQGELAQFYDGEQGMRYLAYVELLKNGVRGNHYHLRKQEWIYVLQGGVLLTLEDVHSPGRVSVKALAGDVVYIHTGIAHALETLEPGHAVEFSPGRVDPADLHPYKLT